MTVVGVGGLGTLDDTREYLEHTGIQFITLLWTDSWDIWDHYGMETTSDFILLDPQGRRLVSTAQPFSEDHIDRLLTDHGF